VIVLGDSLVTGVGCSVASAARGPVLPRIIAERLASLLGVDVEWIALGVCGADVDTIRREVLPELERKVTRLRRLSSNVNATEARPIHTFFTHRSVSTFDRVYFQLTDELFLYRMALIRSRRPPPARVYVFSTTPDRRANLRRRPRRRPRPSSATARTATRFDRSPRARARRP
jgi:hypothetical protein